MTADNLTPELKEEAKGKTAEELIALAEQKGIELSDEQLERVSGGNTGWTGHTCPNCGSSNTYLIINSDKSVGCYDCNYEW